MGSQSEFEQRSRELRQGHDALEQMDRKRYGEEEFQRRHMAKLATAQTLHERVQPLVEEARKRRFAYFNCELGSSSQWSIRLQFADRDGAFYERSLSINKVAVTLGLKPTMIDALEINGSVLAYVRGLDGIKMLGRGMKAKRVRANAGD